MGFAVVLIVVSPSVFEGKDDVGWDVSLSVGVSVLSEPFVALGPLVSAALPSADVEPEIFWLLFCRNPC